MTSRVLLVSPAMTASLRQARFDDGAPLDDRGRADARAAAGSLPTDALVVTSASARCRETAKALGLTPTDSPTELAGLEMGHWRGRSLHEVTESEPEALARWLTDPEYAPVGGDSVVGLRARVVRWLDATAAGAGRVVAVVEPEVVRAAVIHAMGAPPAAFWRLDVEPLTVTELSGRAGRWNLRLGRPVNSL